MKKTCVCLALLFMIQYYVLALVPTFYGARSLSLGYSSLAFNYDVNSIFINPALLSTTGRTMSGYQYEQSYFDYQDFMGILNEALAYNLRDFQHLNAGEKESAISTLNDLFSSKHGIYGFRASLPGVISKDYGLAVSIVKTAIMNPAASDILNRPPEDISDEDIAGLEMNLIGFRYTQISLSYALDISQGMAFGITFHYMFGKIGETQLSIVNDLFSTSNSTSDYLESAWEKADESFYKLNVDLSVTAAIGKYFKAAVIARNIGNPTFVTSERDIVLERRYTAGIAFRPDFQWGIYLDLDINKTDLFYNGNDVQFISLGVEKGFFENKILIRAGFLSDLTEKYFLGSRSNSLYGVGFGFNMKSILVDFGLGIDSGGAVNNLAISGFFTF
jgi:hypothetical protein